MTQIIIDSGLAGKLKDVTEQVELCDPTGKVVGRFFPLIDLAEWELVSREITDEELTRREQANEKQYTTAEVLDYCDRTHRNPRWDAPLSSAPLPRDPRR